MLDRVEEGSLSVLQAADDLGVSGTWVRHLLANRQNHLGDPSVYRKDMLARLNTDDGRALYAQRKVTVEPVFGNIKANLRCRRFNGRGIQAVSGEWRLFCSPQPLEGPNQAAGGRLSLRSSPRGLRQSGCSCEAAGVQPAPHVMRQPGSSPSTAGYETNCSTPGASTPSSRPRSLSRTGGSTTDASQVVLARGLRSATNWPIGRLGLDGDLLLSDALIG